MAEGEQDTFNALQALSQRFISQAKGLPAQQKIVPTCQMVCFSLLGVKLAVLLEDIAELLELPNTTQLPRVKPWVKGVANLHGRLLPVVSLVEFLGGQTKTSPHHQRVIVIDIDDVYVGLSVDRVYGMKRFKVDSHSRNVEGIPEVLSAYIDGCFEHESERWLLFQPARLVADSGFLDVAA